MLIDINPSMNEPQFNKIINGSAEQRSRDQLREADWPFQPSRDLSFF